MDNMLVLKKDTSFWKEGGKGVVSTLLILLPLYFLLVVFLCIHMKEFWEFLYENESFDINLKFEINLGLVKKKN